MPELAPELEPEDDEADVVAEEEEEGADEEEEDEEEEEGAEGGTRSPMDRSQVFKASSEENILLTITRTFSTALLIISVTCKKIMLQNKIIISTKNNKLISGISPNQISCGISFSYEGKR